MSKVTSQSVDYMELRGASKDADCRKVEVQGGVSTERGCCNAYEPANGKVTEFRCGVCEYVVPNESKDKFFG